MMDETTTVELDGFVDARFVNATPEVRAKIINMYYVMVDNAQISTQNNSKEMEDMRLHNDRIISGLRAQVTMFVEDREKYADGLLREANKEKEYMKEIIDVLKNTTAAATPSYTSATNKGDVGEDMIMSYLETIPGTKITKTADKAMSTDIWCTYGNCNIMIESKHVKRVKRCEMDKFHRDVAMNEAMDGAIFISISDDVRIPHKMKYFDCEMFEGRVPCVYVSNFESNKHTLFAALQWMKLYKQRCGDNASISRLRDIFTGIMKDWETQTEALRKLKGTANSLLSDIVTIEAGMRRSFNVMTAALDNEVGSREVRVDCITTVEKKVDEETHVSLATSLVKSSNTSPQVLRGTGGMRMNKKIRRPIGAVDV